jgi:hypothetical protein
MVHQDATFLSASMTKKHILSYWLGGHKEGLRQWRSQKIYIAGANSNLERNKNQKHA